MISMREKDMLVKLNILKEVKPGADWQAKNRELLISQVYAGQERPDEAFSIFTFKLPFEILNTARPAMVLAFIFFLFFGSGAWGMKLAQNTKPGDSLYPAKRMGEQTQLALTFDQKEKVKLQLDFAANRANELSEVLAEPNGNKDEKVEQLVNDFNRQITRAKTALVRISPEATPTTVPVQPEAPEDDAMFSANLSKDASGLSISEQPATPKPAETTAPAPADTPTTTPPQVEETPGASTTAEMNLNTGGTKAILEQAKALLDKDDVTATLDKIEEASQTINPAPVGQVKGEEETVSTSSPSQ
jgi:hypothetical protein